MVRLELRICARLENITNLHLQESDDWHFKTKCTHCNNEADHVIYFDCIGLQAIPGSPGKAHYIAKCKFCERKGYI